MIKQAFRRFLLKKGWYNRLRFSRLFRWYQYAFKPQDLLEENREFSFYQSFLGTGNALVFDIGANDGHKTAAFLQCSEKVVSVEPDPHSLEILKARFRKQKNRVQIEPAAVSNTVGQTELFVHHPGSAFNTIQPAWRMILEADPGQRWNETIRFNDDSITVPTTTLPALISKYGKPDFVKIDAEGSEWTILQQLNEPVRFISFECLLPDYLCSIKNCIHYLDSLHPQTGFAIAVNEKLISGFLSAVEIIRYLDAGALVHFEIVVKMDAVR